MSFEDINRAKEFARKGHDSIKQVRKYTKEPYWVHTEKVAADFFDYATNYQNHSPGDQWVIDGTIAAHLHDIPEDVNIYPFDLRGIREKFGTDIAYLVAELTHKYTSVQYPFLNRAERKILEAWRLGTSSYTAQTIKIFDLIDNTKSIVEYDKGFAVTYLKEKEHLLSVFTQADKYLLDKAKRQLTREKKKLNIS